MILVLNFVLLLGGCGQKPTVEEQNLTVEEQREAFLAGMQKKGQFAGDPTTTMLDYEIKGSDGVLQLQLDLEMIQDIFKQQGQDFDFEDFKQFQIETTPQAFQGSQFEPVWKIFDSLTLKYHNKDSEFLFEVICTSP